MKNDARSLRPTRKWISTQIIAATALVTTWIMNSAWDKALTIGTIGLISQADIGYLMPNSDTPGGVPLKKRECPSHLSLTPGK